MKTLGIPMEDFLFSSPVASLVTIITCVIIGLIIHARWKYGTLERLGIPVVKPHFLFGSLFNSRFTPTGWRDVKWMKEKGQVFGVYDGRQPQIFVCDPDLLRLIMVLDTSYFDSNHPLDFGDKFLNEMPDYLPRDKWRIVRSFTSSAFSGAKLRLMNFPMKDSLNKFVGNMKLQIESTPDGVLRHCEFDKVLFAGLTDVALRCLFNIQDNTNRFPNLLHELANPEGLKYPLLKTIASSFPILFKFLPPTLLHPCPAKEFRAVIESLMKTRTAPMNPPDLVDICMDQIKKLDTPEYKTAKMTKDTILLQAFNSFFSGQDETSLVVSAMIYHVLKSTPESGVEDKLYAEIDSLWEGVEEGGIPPREKLIKAEYLHGCIQEALRFYPFYNAKRTCTKDWYCEKYDFTVPKGMAVMAPLWAVNRNPECFENPDEFNPDRWTNGNDRDLHPYAFSSFGHGPRTCTGKPLAMQVLRVVSSILFKNFKFHLREDSELNFHADGPWVFISHEPIYFDISLR